MKNLYKTHFKSGISKSSDKSVSKRVTGSRPLRQFAAEVNSMAKSSSVMEGQS